MTKPLTVLDYSRRIERVIDHIGAHLDEPLDLDELYGSPKVCLACHK